MKIGSKLPRALAVAAFVATLGLATPAPASEAGDAVAALLFEAKDFARAPKDGLLTYNFERRVKAEDPKTPSFTDVIELRLAAAETADARDVSVVLFKGPMHRPAGPFPATTSNPVLLLALEYHLVDLTRRLAGNSRYVKNAIRAGLRDRSKVEDIEATLGDRRVPARRVVTLPFEADPSRARFGAYAATRYEFTIAEEVPGRILEVRITTPDPAGGAPLIEEVMRYVEVR